MGLNPYLEAPPPTNRRPGLHIDALTSLVLWSEHAFPVRDHARLPQPLSFPSLPTKKEFNLNQVFLLPPSSSADEIPPSSPTAQKPEEM